MTGPSSDAAAPRGVDLERTWLDDSSWVDLGRGWLAEPDEVFEWARREVPWRQGRLWRYERWVDEPRLGGTLPPGLDPHPVLPATQRALQHHYRVQLGRPTMVHYRDGADHMAFHRDRDLRWLENTVVVLLVLGAHRPFHLRPRAGRWDHDAPAKGTTIAFTPGRGDLLVMGGACQERWEHSVPQAPGVGDARISVQWRWTSRRGRPAVGASYRAPRNYSR
jgi:alkylated DNA repair dioxygenase AlkB